MPSKYKPKTDRKNGKHKPAEVPPKYEPGFLMKLDGRTGVAKALKANYEAIVSDLGGEDGLSYFQRSLVERALWMEAIIRDYEHQLATTNDKKSVDALLGKWTQMVNAYSGLVSRLGLEREASSRPWVIDAETSETEVMEDE